MEGERAVKLRREEGESRATGGGAGGGNKGGHK